MERTAALLRAINITGRYVKMERLRELFGQLGLQAVESFIASGNVIFATPPVPSAVLAAQIEAHLLANLGFPVIPFLRTLPELAAVARHQPFDPALGIPERMAVGFLRDQPDPAAIRRVLALRSPAVDLHIHGRELYWLPLDGAGPGVDGLTIEKAVGGPLTMRNLTTVRKIVEKWGEA